MSTEARRLLQIKPVHKKQQENFDRVLKCITHLIYLLVATAKTVDQKQKVRQHEGRYSKVVKLLVIPKTHVNEKLQNMNEDYIF